MSSCGAPRAALSHGAGAVSPRNVNIRTDPASQHRPMGQGIGPRCSSEGWAGESGLVLPRTADLRRRLGHRLNQHRELEASCGKGTIRGKAAPTGAAQEAALGAVW